jgi:hypothetical protein
MTSCYDDTLREGLAAVIYGGAPIETIGVGVETRPRERFITLFRFPDKGQLWRIPTY